MLPINIGITGHRPSGFTSIVRAQEFATSTVIKYMNAHDSCEFILGGCIGADTWVAEACILHEINFHLRLPFPANVQGKYWSVDDMNTLLRHTAAAKSVTIVGERYASANYHIRDRQIVDQSDFIVCFWEGARKGGTFSTIKYAINSGKKVFNAMNEFQEVIL
jgi:uncharacterized phage-like protein YoqJ